MPVITVKVNQGTRFSVKSTAVFSGSTDVGAKLDAALYTANVAMMEIASLANTKYDKTGGVISGDVTVIGDIVANRETIDGGEFI